MTSSQSPARSEFPTVVDAHEAFGVLGRLTLSARPLELVLQRLAVLASRVVPGACEVSVSLIGEGRAVTAVGTGGLAFELDAGQVEQGDGPCLQAARDGETVTIADARTEPRWPEYTPLAVERGSLGTLSVPVIVHEHVAATLNSYALAAGAFDQDSRELAVTFASYAAVALANARLRELHQQLAERLAPAS